MHEFSLARTLLEQVDALRRQQAAERVVSVRVSVGEFSGVEPELFRGAFQTLVDESSMRGAQLEMERVPLRVRCDLCEREFAVERFRFECSECDSRQVTIVGGQELVLESVTVEHSEETSLDQTTS